MKLHEYIGSLVSSVQQARVNADLQAVQVAESYAEHQLLSHFPVPRMRLKDVEMTIPVAVDTGQIKKATNLEPLDNREFNAQAYKETLAAIGQKSLPKEQSRQLRDVISKKSNELEKELLVGGRTQALNNFSNIVAKQAIELQKVDVSAADKKELTAKISDRLNDRLISEIKPVQSESALENIDIRYEADILREKKPESLLNIKLTIIEEGVEWHRMEAQDGKITRTLIPE